MAKSRQASFRKLAALYERMALAYQEAAAALGLSCENCPDNCCASYFQHHTYIEWAYLWQGLKSLAPERLEEARDRARDYLVRAGTALSLGRRPGIMCPLNQEGLCGLYSHRMMICRLHGVPNAFTRPDGQRLSFPGCWRSQELCRGLERVPVLERTEFYRDLARLEAEFLGSRARRLPRVDLTLAEMIDSGPPGLG
ncbi:MAG: hypothetical protein PHV85_09560 [Desulfovibrionaceae bacterium]|nr:hypothetical protein [Desulfovibrionaceae bacterium]